MKNHKPGLLLISALALILMNPGLAESTQVTSNNRKIAQSVGSTAGSASDAELSRDGADFLKNMSEAASVLESYSFQSQMTVFKGDKTIHENSKFYFKKPRKMKAEELGPYKKGSVAVLLPNGKIKGHLGGLLSKFTATVDANSEYATSANGYPLGDSDFYGMSQVMLKLSRDGKKTFVSEKPVAVGSQTKPVYVLEMYTTSARNELMKRAYVDPQTLLPVEWFDYKDGKLFAHTLWKDLQVNVEISDASFVI